MPTENRFDELHVLVCGCETKREAHRAKLDVTRACLADEITVSQAELLLHVADDVEAQCPRRIIHADLPDWERELLRSRFDPHQDNLD